MNQFPFNQTSLKKKATQPKIDNTFNIDFSLFSNIESNLHCMTHIHILWEETNSILHFIFCIACGNLNAKNLADIFRRLPDSKINHFAF